jgi:threonine aldolase
MGAEAIIFLKPGLAENFPYVRKQQMQLASKMRFLSAQMVALLEDDLWKQNASHANAMAKLLEKQIKHTCPKLPILYPVEANSVFVELPSMKMLKQLQEKYFFWPWDRERPIARFMTAWDSEPAHIEAFVLQIKQWTSNG